MENELMISVIVLTYNASLEKTYQTLNSIIKQKGISFEIIVADDGSKNNNFSALKDFFYSLNFNDFKFVENKINQGTVKNVISALKVCSGQYVKAISPGDFLYDENTLRIFGDEIEKTKAEVYFGRAVYYSKNEDKIVFFKKSNPEFLEVYKRNNTNGIKRNYLIKRDYILGAALIVKTSVFLSYLKKLEGKVIYAEDCSFICMVANDIFPVFIDSFLIWYEFGGGISTSSSNVWTQKIEEDNKETFKYLLQAKTIKKYIYDMYFSENFLYRSLLKIIFYPKTLLMKVFPTKKIPYEDRLDYNKLNNILIRKNDDK